MEVMDSRTPIADCRVARSWVVYKAMKVIAQNPNCELSKKFISNRIKYPQQDLKQDEAIRQLGLAVKDGLLNYTGSQYSFGSTSFEHEQHDWYCYRCHDAGQVFKCNNCWRVYHPGCAQFTNPVCDICQSFDSSDPSTKHDQQLISQELKPIMMKLHEEVKQVPPMSCFDALFYNSIPLQEMRKLVYNWKVSFASIDRKINAFEYKSFQQFLIDIEDIAHNLIVVYGPKSRVAKFAAQMTEITSSEAQMLSECITCAKNFINHRPEMEYFHIPCDPPHQIVFARFQKYPYWPGKMYTQDEKTAQVWFFGGKLAKFTIEKTSIYGSNIALAALRKYVIKNNANILYRKALEMYDNYVDNLGKSEDKLLDTVRPETLSGMDVITNEMNENEDAFKVAPVFFAETFSNLITKEFKKENGNINGRSLSDLKIITNGNQNGNIISIINGNGAINGNGIKIKDNFIANECMIISTPVRSQIDRSHLENPIMDTNSNMSFTFNGDSMNSFTNSEDMLGDRMPASPRSVIKSKSAKKRDRSFNQDTDSIRDENAKLKKRIKEAEEKIKQMKLEFRDVYSQEYVKNLQKDFNQKLDEAKKKTWCWVCGQEAFYYCCFKNFYCSPECQVKHWWAEHRLTCYRKKNKNKN